MFPRMHVSLYVSNLADTIAFYTAFFGQTPSKEKAGYAKYEIEAPSLIISFIENPEKAEPFAGHLGFQVGTPEVLAERLRLAKANNLVELEEIGTSCCYAVQDKFWAKDPDGTLWEVYFFHEDAEFNDPRYASQEAEACCSPATSAPAPVKEEKCAPGSGCC